MISYKERQYLCWFLSVPGIGAVTGMRLFKQYKSFEEIYNCLLYTSDAADD